MDVNGIENTIYQRKGISYRSLRTECPACREMILKTTRHQTKTDIHNLSDPDNPKLAYKQMHEKKQQDKQSNKINNRLRHLQQTIKDLMIAFHHI